MKTLKHVTSQIAAAVVATAVVSLAALAQTTTNLTVVPTTPVFDANNVTGVPLDAAPGFSYGSFASDGTGKTDMYFTPTALFGRAITLGEIASISYWTKTGADHASDPRDWFLAIYTKPYAGDVSTPTWYGDRIGAEPYFSAARNDPANAWNQWSTDGPDNQLRFFESTAGAPGATFGSYTDPFLAAFVAQSALSGSTRGNKEILFISVQTASGWANGFTGQLDGLRIELTDGSVATVNFEPYLVPASRDACKKNGWTTLLRADGSAFQNQGDCVSWVNTAK